MVILTIKACRDQARERTIVTSQTVSDHDVSECYLALPLRSTCTTIVESLLAIRGSVQMESEAAIVTSASSAIRQQASPVRIGIIGAGFWAVQFYLPYLFGRDDVTCVGIVRRGRAELAVLKDQFKLQIATEDVSELLAMGCDGIIVSSPNTLHYTHAVQALNAGAHVLVEKPMCLTFEDALALQHEVDRTGRKMTVAYGYNYLPMATWAIDLVQSGAIGRPLSLTGYMASSLLSLFSGQTGYGTIDVGSLRFEAESSTWADAATGGGYLYGQLSHLVGLGMAFSGAMPTRVYSRAQRLPSGSDIDVSLVAELSDGGTATFSGNGRLPLGTRYPMEMTVAGEHGSLVIDFQHDRAEAFLGEATFPDSFDWEGEVAISGRPPDAAWQATPGDGTYTCEGPVDYLISCCTSQEAVNRAPCSLAVRAVAILDAAHRSAITGEPVHAYERTAAG